MVGQNHHFATRFAINKSRLRQSNAFDESVSYTTTVQTFFQFFYQKKKAMLSPATLLESTLMFTENSIKVTRHFIKHTLFINFIENGKNTNGTIIFDIKFALLFMNGYNISLFNSERKNELNSELSKL